MTLTKIDGIFCSTDRCGISEELSLNDVVQSIARNAFCFALDGDLLEKDIPDMLRAEWGPVELSPGDYDEVTRTYKEAIVQSFKHLIDHAMGI